MSATQVRGPVARRSTRVDPAPAVGASVARPANRRVLPSGAERERRAAACLERPPVTDIRASLPGMRRAGPPAPSGSRRRCGYRRPPRVRDCGLGATPMRASATAIRATPDVGGGAVGHDGLWLCLCAPCGGPRGAYGRTEVPRSGPRGDARPGSLRPVGCRARRPGVAPPAPTVWGRAGRGG